MSLVKICGVTRVEDARRAVELGADLIGLNFWPRSPRYLTPEQALPVAEAVRGRAQVVGVFVDPPPGRPEAVAQAVGLDLVQFHGDEGPERLAPWGRRAIKVFRLSGPPEPEQLAAYPKVWGFLFDVRHPDYGGTGKSWDYGTLSVLASSPASSMADSVAVPPRPFLVAGGIGPDNARQALEASGAAGIDICSGVETAPGIKDGERMQRLFAEVRR